jgi:heme exporter protein B
MSHVWMLLAKDLRVEWRTREITTAMILLSVLFAIVAGTVRPDAAAAPAVMWMTYAFGSALGFARALAWEREDIAALRLAPVDPAAIFLAKTTANWLLLVVMQVVTVPLVAAMFAPAVWSHAVRLGAPLGLGGLALAATGTLLGALLLQARLREILLPLLMLPLALPAVIASVGATIGILDGLPLAAVLPQLQLLGAFDILIVTSGVLLFNAILDE